MTTPTPEEAAVQVLELRQLFAPGNLMLQAYVELAPILAKEVQRLQSLHESRDTQKGQWPKEGQRLFVWIEGGWSTRTWYERTGMDGHLWVPALPAPEGGE